MSDNTYIARRLGTRIGIWNAYNRVPLYFELPTDPAGLDCVRNPHFTYHPGNATFHLKSNKDRKKDAVFSVVAVMDIAVAQEGETPWVRAASSPLSAMKSSASVRPGNTDVEELVFSWPDENVSILMGVDFVQHGLYRLADRWNWFMPWRDFTVKLSIQVVSPRIATLAWTHSY